ncbi:SDR family oxidoreductase [Actinomadura fibrosa]|uniref:SDR family oxidoreductase n=1 Tax=Actinomadura fibrosa TaxID=111802 RepID=A0ABW2XMZ9_9ACTN|nr:SDR family oxidoreductase [Actinomadura fibrosa]
MSLALDLSGRTVVVTGGVRGVGAGISRAFLEAGADVVAVARREPEALPEAAGRTARFVSLDVRDPDAVQAFADGLDDVHVLVNNAGGGPFAPLAERELRVHLKILELNLTAPLIMARAVYTAMRARGHGGSVVNIGSVSGVRPSPGTAAYGAAKAGLDSLTRSLAVEWAPHVRVNSITVGMVRTEQAHLHYGDEAGVAAVERTVPAGRMADPFEVGAACVYLASDLAAYVTGSSLLLHGGGERPAFLDAATANRPPAGTEPPAKESR